MKKILTEKYLKFAALHGVPNRDIIKHFQSPSFRGVFSVNDGANIKRALKKRTEQLFNSCIVNLSKKNTPGSHFVTLMWYPDQKVLYYLDPSGLPPFQWYIEKLLYRTLKTQFVYYNYARFQKLGSNFCAYYCIYFILLYQALSEGKKELIAQLKPLAEVQTTQIKQDKTLIQNIVLLLKK